jgi:hypothetical protein
MAEIKVMLEEDKNMAPIEIQRRLLEHNATWTFSEQKIREKLVSLKKEEQALKKAKLGEVSGDETHALAPGTSLGLASPGVPRSVALSAWKPVEGIVAKKAGKRGRKRKHEESGANMDDFDTDSEEGVETERGAAGRGKGAANRQKGTSSAVARSHSSDFQKLSFTDHPILIRKDCQFYVVNGNFGEEKLAILYVIRRVGRDDHVSCKLIEDRQQLLIKVVWNKFSFTGLSIGALNDETIQKLQYAFSHSIAEPHLSEDIFELPFEAHPDHQPRRHEYFVDGGKLVYMEIVLSASLSETNWVLPKAHHSHKAGEDF